MKKQLPVLFFIFFIYNSCTRPCEDLLGLESSSMVIYPFNLSLNSYFYLQAESQSSFKKDSLQVINEDGRRFPNISFLLEQDPRGGLQNFYAIKISPAFIFPDDSSAFHTEKSRKLYLKYNHNTADTLTLIFRAKKTKCDKTEYEYLKIYHRNQLIASINDYAFIDFTLKH